MRIVESAADANYLDETCEVISRASVAMRALNCPAASKAFSTDKAA